MAELPDADFAAAEERGAIAYATQPRAVSVRYDAEDDRVIIQLANGCMFAFPPRLVQGLEHASAEELAEVDAGPVGFGLHWERLDVDISVAGLLAGRFGSARYMAERFGPQWDAVAAG